MSHTDRVVLLIDMDCFYCQVEEQLKPKLKGKPIAVVQYNEWRGGGIIAVNYVAKRRGVTRHMRGNDAKKKCPDIELVRVPVVRGKADLTKYRDAGKKVANVLQKFTAVLERASVDEAYLDISNSVKERISKSFKVTPDLLKNTHVVETNVEDFLQNLYEDDINIDNLKLAIGGVIAEEIRKAVYQETGYTCSAGIAHNKILAKLACGLHKPNQQTILPHTSVEQFFKHLPIYKIRNLGGKFGDIVAEDFGVKTVGELTKFTEKQLKQRYDERMGSWLYNIARGIDMEPVTERLVSKSLGCCKKFPGKGALFDSESVEKWLHELAEELIERLEKDLAENNRKAKGFVVSFWNDETSGSKTRTLTAYDVEKVKSDAYEIIRKNCMKSDGSYHINFLGLTATKFEPLRNTKDLKYFFGLEESAKSKSKILEIKDMENLITESEDIAGIQNNIKIENVNYLDIPSTSSNINQEMLREQITITDDNVMYNYETTENCFGDEKQNDDSDDSVSNEVFDILNNDQPKSQFSEPPPKKSFFIKYFDEIKVEKERNFDTSRHLNPDDNVLDEELSKENHQTNTETVNNHDVNIQRRTGDFLKSESSTFETTKNTQPHTSSNVMENSLNAATEICLECGKSFTIIDFIPHMDFHFALSILQEEAEVDRTKHSAFDSNNKVSNKTANKKSTKRKSTGDLNKKKSISSYFKPATGLVNDLSNDAEVCPECKKSIKSSDLRSHLDYHMAKRIHLEINSIKPVPAKSSVSKDFSKTNNKNDETKNKKVPSVISFFKQSL